MAAARLTVTDDLPTPPLPDATAYTRVRLLGLAKGISFSGAPPRSCDRSSARCSSLMTSTSTDVTPSSARRALLESLVRVSFIGQPETVRKIARSTLPASSISTDWTIPSSVIGLRISGSLTFDSAVSRASRLGSATDMCSIVCVVPRRPDHRRCLPQHTDQVTTHRRRSPVCRDLLGVLRGGWLLVADVDEGAVLELVEQRAQLGAHEVTSRLLAQGQSQRGDLAGQELGVGEVALVPGPVLLEGDTVPVGLAVLGEQDEGRGIRRLQAQHQRQEDERELVEDERAWGEDVPGDPRGDEDRHADEELCRPHEAGELLRQDAEGLLAQGDPRQHPGALLLRLVELVSAYGSRRQASVGALAHGFTSSSCRSSRQSSGRMWSSTSSTVTAPMSRPSSSTTGSETRL